MADSGNDPLGSARIVNNLGTSGGKDRANTDPLGAEIDFDGQNYYVGPNDRMVIPTIGMANVSVMAGTPIRFDDSKATKQFPNSSPMGQ